MLTIITYCAPFYSINAALDITILVESLRTSSEKQTFILNVFFSIHMDGSWSQFALIFTYNSHSNRIYLHCKILVCKSIESSSRNVLGMILHLSKPCERAFSVTVILNESIARPTLHGTRTDKMRIEPCQTTIHKAQFFLSFQ